ncbi:MAG: hypothetical protein IH994_07175 [Proteobacteria bacterium]|nr:hypothetical protein [Pseudomonadota bacterium]
MEWLLFLSLGVIGVESPPPVAYSTRTECVEAAKKITGENKWLHYLEIEPGALKAEPGVLRPTVSCKPAEWSKNPKGYPKGSR